MAYIGTQDHASHIQGGGYTATTAPCANSVAAGNQEHAHLEGMMSSSYFHFGRRVQLLFHDWAPSSGVTFALTLAAVLVLAVFYEWFAEVKRRSLALLTDPPVSSFASAPPPKQDAHPHLTVDGADTGTSSSYQAFQRLHGVLMVTFCSLMRRRQIRLVVVTVVYVVHSAMGYVLMLVVMTFNAGIFLSVLLGLAIGFFLFRVSHPQASSPHP